MGKRIIYNKIIGHVRLVQERNRAANRYPDHALITGDNLIGKTVGWDNRLEFYVTLGEMVELGLIETGRTINDTYVRVVEK